MISSVSLSNADFLLNNAGMLSLERFKVLYSPECRKTSRIMPRFLLQSIIFYKKEGLEVLDYILSKRIISNEQLQDLGLFCACYMNEKDGIELSKKLIQAGISPSPKDATEIIRYNMINKDYYMNLLIENNVQPEVLDLMFLSIRENPHNWLIKFLENNYDFNAVSKDDYKQTLLEKICLVLSPEQCSEKLINVFIKNKASIDFIRAETNMVQRKILNLYKIEEENKILNSAVDSIENKKKVIKL